MGNQYKNKSILRDAIKQAVSYPQSTATPDMKYCMIANLGMIGLDKSERAQFYIANPSIDNTSGAVKYVESGLNDEVFVHHVADVLQGFVYNGRMSDLKKVAEGMFSVRISSNDIEDIRSKFPSDRMAFMAFEDAIVMQDVMNGFVAFMRAPNVTQPRPYLDS